MAQTMDGRDGGEAAAPRVGSVASAIAILRHLGSYPAGAGVNAIARALGLGPSSCFNILKTLTTERFLDFDPVSKLYTLGPGAVVVARRALDPGGALPLVRGDLERLAERFQLTAALWRTSRERVFLLGFAESEATTRIHMTVGQRLPILTGALGRCVAAHGRYERAELASRLAGIQWANAPSIEDYLVEVDLARARGWAIDESCFMRGVTTIAAPVTDDLGRVAFSVSSTLFTGQYDAAKLEEIGAVTKAVADRLSGRVFGADGRGVASRETR
jgi:DNA-binding IclR family transcriptional regulator